MTNEVSNIIFEAAIQQAFNNKEILSPSMEYFIQTGKVNGQFMLTLKRLIGWVEKKTLEACTDVITSSQYADGPVKPDCFGLSTWCCCDKCQEYSEHYFKPLIAEITIARLTTELELAKKEIDRLEKMLDRSQPELY